MIRWPHAAPARPSCPHRRLRRLLARELPPGIVMAPSTLRPWASANFIGARHLFPCVVGAPDLAALQHRLGAVDWPLSGHIVADLVVELAENGVRIEVLTVED